MQHVLEFDDPVGIGGIERGVFGHVPAFEIVLGVIVRWIGEKQFRWHAFESTIGGFTDESGRCSRLLSCSDSGRPQKQRDGSLLVGMNFLHRRRKKTMQRLGSFTGA